MGNVEDETHRKVVGWQSSRTGVGHLCSKGSLSVPGSPPSDKCYRASKEGACVRPVAPHCGWSETLRLLTFSYPLTHLDKGHEDNDALPCEPCTDWRKLKVNYLILLFLFIIFQIIFEGKILLFYLQIKVCHRDILRYTKYTIPYSIFFIVLVHTT